MCSQRTGVNVVLTFLSANWQRLSLDRFGKASGLSAVLATPRFRASSHVVSFVLTDQKPDPILVVKVPRLPGDGDRLNCEAQNLRMVQSARAGGFESIPRLIGFENHLNHRLLIETALAGRSMSCHLRGRRAGSCLETAVNWLIELHRATAHHGDDVTGWYERLAQEPIERFLEAMPPDDDTSRTVAQTLDLTFWLRRQKIPLVFEHGDLGPPNILLGQHGRIGVVDWELSKPRGLPLVDLFFLLALVGFARRRARRPLDYLAAFHDAFFASSAWARPYLTRYANQLQLAPEIVAPLFILTWGRYVAELTARLHDFRHATGQLAGTTLEWLRTNRYYALWRHTIEHANQLNLVG